MDEGALDLIFAKRRAGDGRGRMVWREEMVWIAAPDWRRDRERPLPLVLYPPRSITREAVLAALEKANVSWRIACTCGSLSGLVGAVLGGLGVGAQSARLKVGRDGRRRSRGRAAAARRDGIRRRPRARPAERAGSGDGRHDPRVRPRFSGSRALSAGSRIAPQGAEFGRLTDRHSRRSKTNPGAVLMSMPMTETRQRRHRTRARSRRRALAGGQAPRSGVRRQVPVRRPHHRNLLPPELRLAAGEARERRLLRDRRGGGEGGLSRLQALPARQARRARSASRGGQARVRTRSSRRRRRRSSPSSRRARA